MAAFTCVRARLRVQVRDRAFCAYRAHRPSTLAKLSSMTPSIISRSLPARRATAFADTVQWRSMPVAAPPPFPCLGWGEELLAETIGASRWPAACPTAPWLALPAAEEVTVESGVLTKVRTRGCSSPHPPSPRVQGGTGTKLRCQTCPDFARGAAVSLYETHAATHAGCVRRAAADCESRHFVAPFIVPNGRDSINPTQFAVNCFPQH